MGMDARSPRHPSNAEAAGGHLHAPVPSSPGCSQNPSECPLSSGFFIGSHWFSSSPLLSPCSNVTFSVRPALTTLFQMVLHSPSTPHTVLLIPLSSLFFATYLQPSMRPVLRSMWVLLSCVPPSQRMHVPRGWGQRQHRVVGLTLLVS